MGRVVSMLRHMCMAIFLCWKFLISSLDAGGDGGEGGVQNQSQLTPFASEGAAAWEDEGQGGTMAVVGVLWPVMTAIFLAGTFVILIFPFYTYIPSSGLIGEQLPKVSPLCSDPVLAMQALLAEEAPSRHSAHCAPATSFVLSSLGQAARTQSPTTLNSCRAGLQGQSGL